ncbi:MAG: helix-turn-helix transcriptional regulator [Vampirovibrio sp.]|nr:helix-turn-helix transcriptional regulator [Vampirovibrio sp.]
MTVFIKKVADIARLVKEARLEQGFTQVRLAQLCNVGTRFIVDLEKGKTTCQLDKTLHVLVNLGIRLEYNQL